MKTVDNKKENVKNIYDCTTEERLNYYGVVDIKSDLNSLMAEEGYVYTEKEFAQVEKLFMKKLIANDYLNLMLKAVKESGLAKPMFTKDNLLINCTYEFDCTTAVHKRVHNAQFKLVEIDGDGNLTGVRSDEKHKGTKCFPHTYQIKSSCSLKK